MAQLNQILELSRQKAGAAINSSGVVTIQDVLQGLNYYSNFEFN